MKLYFIEELDDEEEKRDWIRFYSKFSKVKFNRYVEQVIEDFVPVLDIIDQIESDFYYCPDGRLIDSLERLLKGYRKQLKYLEKENSVQGLQDTLYKLGDDINQEIEFWAELNGLV